MPVAPRFALKATFKGVVYIKTKMFSINNFLFKMGGDCDHLYSSFKMTQKHKKYLKLHILSVLKKHLCLDFFHIL